jgi:D-glycero-alpha-D-manno-heptose-7-phosphate kinase
MESDTLIAPTQVEIAPRRGPAVTRIAQENLSSSAPSYTISAQAPCRADLAGSTLDLWPLYLFHPGGITLNFAVDIMAKCAITLHSDRSIKLISEDTGREDRFASIEQLSRARQYRHALAARLVKHFQPDVGFTLKTSCDSPVGGGLAGSSALTIAVAGALCRLVGRDMPYEQLRVMAQNVEAQTMHVPTGCQDYYPALYGGINAIHLKVDGVSREALPYVTRDVDDRFLLVYTGVPRKSGINNWEVFKAYVGGDKKVAKNFDHIAEISKAMYAAISKPDWTEVARLIREEWKFRRSNYANISTPLIDRLITVASKAGGRAAKVCGAGGGGCLILMVKDGAKERVAQAIRMNGGQVLNCNVAHTGLVVEKILLSSRAATGHA